MDFEIFHSFCVPIKTLKLFGLWQRKTSAWSYFAYGLILHLIFIEVFTAFQFAYLFTFKTFEDFATLMTMLPTYIAFIVKTLNFYHSLSAIEELFEMIHQACRAKSIDEKFRSRLNTVDKMFKVFLGSAVANCFIGMFTPFIYHKLPLRMWFPFTYECDFVIFWIGALYQIAESITAPVIVVLDMFPVFFMAYILAMLEQLCDRL